MIDRQQEISMRNVIAAIILAVLFATPSIAEDKIKGKYEVIGSLEKLKGAKQIEMIELFNYSCGHCFKFLETAKRLHKKYKGKLLHKKYPIYWEGKQTAYPSMAYYISDEQGMEEKFTQALFDTNFKMNMNIFQPRIIKILSRDFGIEKEMVEGFKSERIKKKVQQALGIAQKYNANETPTVIVNGVLKVTPSIVDGDVDVMTDNLIVIFDDILSRK